MPRHVEMKSAGALGSIARSEKLLYRAACVELFWVVHLRFWVQG